jgi:nucleoside phosphorylase
MEGHKLSEYLSAMVGKYPAMQSEFVYQGAQHDQLFEADYEHPGNDVTCGHFDVSRLIHRPARSRDVPVVFYGLIASANQVMRHGQTRDRLGRELHVLCFEKGAAGLMDKFPCLVIRGICDYSDSHKNKRWQPYAAATAADSPTVTLAVPYSPNETPKRRVSQVALLAFSICIGWHTG